MPTIASNRQPTIAIITAQYCEKLAVDAMLENKETFVRYTTVGKLRTHSRGSNTILEIQFSDSEIEDLLIFLLLFTKLQFS